jgi:pSer/pThr/pTyr-binding forkhead associated (FHA) protein
LKHASTIPVVTCSACGYSNLPGEMFCQNCGVQLPPVASVPPPPPTPVVGASRQGKPVQTSERRQTPSNKPLTEIAGGSEKAGDQGQFSGKLIVRDKGVELPLPPDQPEVIIGRTDPVQNIYPDVDLAGQEGERSGVSRRHARILRHPDGVYIEDLNSTNFTFLNRIRLQPGQTYPLKDRDEIRLGVLTLEYRS